MYSKKGFTIIEVVVVFLLILGITFLILPRSLNGTKQARFISKWTQTYAEIEYMFSVIRAQQEDEIQEKLNKTNDNDNKKLVILESIKPYLRITSEVPSTYKQFYMNGSEVNPSGRYYFKPFYFTSTKEIVGLKWVSEDCKGQETCAILSFDVNGILPPNTWGDDVFGINLLRKGIEPIGKGIDADLLKADCDKEGFGIYCSYYYLMGGRFE